MLNIGIREFSAVIRIFWDYNPSESYVTYNLYYSLDNVTFSLLVSDIPNEPTSYGKIIDYRFLRTSVPGVSSSTPFYLRLTGVSEAALESSPGPSKRINPEHDLVPLTTTSSPNVIGHAYGYDTSIKKWRKINVDNEGTLKVKII